MISLQNKSGNGIASRRLIITVAFLIVASVAVIIMLTVKSKADTRETVARAVLTRTYGATQQDYENLNNALDQSKKDSEILSDYLYTIYGDQLTENGYHVFMLNRIPSSAANIAHEESSDLEVSSIELEPEYSSSKSKCYYAFTLQTLAKKDPSKTLTFMGHITLVRENGKWKVDGASPD